MDAIETGRLILRAWKKEDLPLFIRMNQDPEVMEYFLKALSDQESREFYGRIRKEWEERGYGLYAMQLKGTGGFIGYVGLHHTTFKTAFSPCVEIGWRLCREAWGKGYATEGAKACLEAAFRRFHLTELYSFTSLLNKRSERVMQKIGMQKIGEFDHPLVPAGHPLLRHVLYRMKNEEFSGKSESAENIFPALPERWDELVGLWERSVRATHTFLTEQDIRSLSPVVGKAVKQIGKLLCIPDPEGKTLAFMGVEGDKLEMLFVDVQARAKGLGKMMVKYAIQRLGVCYVDVNEQNPQALGFYEHLGFRVFARSALDSQGNPFPVLHMKYECPVVVPGNIT